MLFSFVGTHVCFVSVGMFGYALFAFSYFCVCLMCFYVLYLFVFDVVDPKSLLRDS